MRQRIYGWDELADLPDSQKRTSPDGKRLVAWYVTEQRLDAYDDDTYWQIDVWELATHQRLKTFLREHSISHSTGGVYGGRLRSVEFSPDGSELVIVQDGLESREKLLVDGG